MSKIIKRKDAEMLFLPINEYGKYIWIINRVRKIPIVIVNTAIRLSGLDFIKFVRLTDNSISASSEIEGSRIKIPIIKMNHPSAIGVKIVFDHKYKIMDFDEINSPIKGNGSKMVDCILSDFPKDWQAVIVMDWSNGFWNKMKTLYNKINWIY